MNLITGINSGLGKYLYEKLPNTVGLNRGTNFEAIKHIKYDTIVHCAFNKEMQITDYKKYLEDNILLTQKLKNLKYKKFIYISSVDVYQPEPNIYSIFKNLTETLIGKNDLILRCSMMLGNTMKSNHVSKIKDNISSINLSEDSEFNYILMDDLVEFFKNKDYSKHSGIIDFVSNSIIKLKDVKKYFGSTTELGNYVYTSKWEYLNPIYNLDIKYNNSSLNNLTKYYGIFQK
jgi:hypothetical protein